MDGGEQLAAGAWLGLDGVRAKYTGADCPGANCSGTNYAPGGQFDSARG